MTRGDRDLANRLARAEAELARLSALVPQGMARSPRPDAADVTPEYLAQLQGNLAYGGVANAVIIRPTGGSTSESSGTEPIEVNGLFNLGTITNGSPISAIRANGKWVATAGWPAPSVSANRRGIKRGKTDGSYIHNPADPSNTVTMSVFDIGDVDTGENITVRPRDHIGYLYADEWLIAIEDERLGDVEDAPNTASPTTVTTSVPHGLTTGDTVDIVGVTGNTNVNGQHLITVTATDQFTIPVSGNGAYTGGGVWTFVTGTASNIWRPLHPSGNMVVGTFDGSALIAPGATGTLSVKRWSTGTDTDTGDNLTARNGGGMPLFPGLKVRAQWDRVDGGGLQWIAYPEEQNNIHLVCDFASPTTAFGTGTATFHYANAGAWASWSITATVRTPFVVPASKKCAVAWDSKAATGQWVAYQIEC